VVWWGSPLEVLGALLRLQQEKRLTAKELDRAQASLKLLSVRWREILPVDSLRNLAEECMHRYLLRSADALQLAAALTWCQSKPTGRVLITFDEQLTEAARLAGFTAAT